MKKIWIFLCILLFGITSYAKEGEPQELYAQSAVLMDADSGRVLFEKNGYEAKAMASTTKIMTCILALERGDVDAVVEVSQNAAAQPRVHLGMQSGEKFYLKDLLYSLMLESHNDTAVAIAEAIGGSVEGFAAMMNEKAKEIGCGNTYFITPNGLDAVDTTGRHSTTAEELAKIMRYCIKESSQREQFLEITQKQSHSFSDTEGKRNFSCNNHNAFLGMMEGALTGKTGFTGDAGYCYVGALKRDERTFIVALLGCGWPNNKGYKWKDTRKLMEYGLEQYTYRNIYEEQMFPKVMVEGGVPENGDLFADAVTGMKEKAGEKEKERKFLLHSEEQVEIRTEFKEELKAPVQAGEEVGSISYYLGDTLLERYPVVLTKSVKAKEFSWYFQKLFENYMLK